MARRLNIERRRKRVRHYTAKRRLRSPLHRAVVFWWGPVLLLTVAALILVGPLWRAVMRYGAVGERFERAYLPPPGLRLIRASEASVTEVIRAGNVKRLAVALSDADVGICMDTVQRGRRTPVRLPLVPPMKVAEAWRNFPSAVLFPKAKSGDTMAGGADGVAVLRMERTLRDIGYAPADGLDRMSADDLRDVRFKIVLLSDGRVGAALRICPVGAETPALRRIRMILEGGRGTGTASGTVWFSVREAEE